MTTLSLPAPVRWRHVLAAAATALLLAACGGGDGSSSGGNGGGGNGGEVAVLDQPFAAVGSSAGTVTLGWTPPAAAATYEVERRGPAGDFVRIASVDARSGGFMDSGLAAATTYSYRLAINGTKRSETAAKAATTTQEQGVVTARGAALGELSGRTLGAAGGTLASNDEQLRVTIPAGAFTADTATETQPVANTAPDGRGNGLKLRLAAAPRLPLVLEVQYTEAQDDEADALRIAVQRPAGDWTSLPLSAIDKGTRTLQALLPPEFVASATAPGASGVEFHVVQYLALSLLPRQARVKVGQSLEFVPWARVRGYEGNAEGCPLLPDGSADCVMQPVLQARQVPLLNSKPGYERYWRVNVVEGGNDTLGHIVPSGSVGGAYTAPNRVPQPATVRVVFHSAHPASGRIVNLSSPVEIWDDAWNGSLNAVDGPSSEGTTLFAKASVRWEPDAANANSPLKRYRGSGYVAVSATDADCSSIAFTPDTGAIDGSSELVFLEVDESQTPFTYRMTLVTLWTSTFSATCKRGSATLPGALAGWGWSVEGTVANDGKLIAGEQTTEDGYRLSWRITR